MSAPVSLNFPVSTASLSGWLPHSGPAVWVDEVRKVDRDSGECRVHLKSSAHYADERGQLRPSCFIEWMAQSFGYVGACQVMLGLGCDGKTEKPEKVFLVQVRDFELVGSPDLTIRPGASVDVRVRRTHRLGPITLIDGEVRESGRDVVLAKARLKLFAS